MSSSGSCAFTLTMRPSSSTARPPLHSLCDFVFQKKKKQKTPKTTKHLHLRNQTVSSLGFFFSFYIFISISYFVLNLSSLSVQQSEMARKKKENYLRESVYDLFCICAHKDHDEQRSQRKGNTDDGQHFTMKVSPLCIAHFMIRRGYTT